MSCWTIYIYIYVYTYIYVYMYIRTYKKFMRLFFCVYPVHISLGQYCQKKLKMGNGGRGGIQKDRMKGGWPYSGGVVCRRGLKPSAHYLKAAQWCRKHEF